MGGEDVWAWTSNIFYLPLKISTVKLYHLQVQGSTSYPSQIRKMVLKIQGLVYALHCNCHLEGCNSSWCAASQLCCLHISHNSRIMEHLLWLKISDIHSQVQALCMQYNDKWNPVFLSLILTHVLSQWPYGSKKKKTVRELMCLSTVKLKLESFHKPNDAIHIFTV